MKKIIFLPIALISVLSFNGFTQSQSLTPGVTVTDPSSGNTWTPSNGDRTYSPEKTYIVFKLWNESQPLTEKEKEDLAALKQQLAKKNIDLVVQKWKTKEDIETAFKSHGIENVEVSTDKGISLKYDNEKIHQTIIKKSGETTDRMTSSFYTTGSTTILIFEKQSPMEPMRPISLCTGKNCENNFVKAFFRIRVVV